MKKHFYLVTLLFVVTFSYAQSKTFSIKSKDIGGRATMKEFFNGFGCTGQNISPQLSWENAPADTKSFAITIYDPNAPTGSGWWHWVVFDIPSTTTELMTNAGSTTSGLMPTGAIQSLTDFGKGGYGGPCPPKGHGDHMYIITVHALKVPKLGLDAKANPALVGFYLYNNTIEKASMVMYAKQ